MSKTPQAQAPPPLNLPTGKDVCEVAVIDTTTSLVSRPSTLTTPDIPGLEWLNLPDYAFLITHPGTGTKLLFDLGTRRDWQNAVPALVDTITNNVPAMKVESEVLDIIREHGVDPSRIKALILSHFHFDHTGNLARLPPDTELIVGPGFEKKFGPGFPSNPTSVFWEEELRRPIFEPPFGESITIGGFPTYDYFGDGSLHILHVPGHTAEHLCALVRTTPDTFVRLGGDCCHFSGLLRPSPYIPMPDQIPPETILDSRLPTPCPCSVFATCHPNRSNNRLEPFLECSPGGPYGTWFDDPATAQKSIVRMIAFDADPHVLTLIAHDPALKASLPLFPDGTINDWKARGYKEEMHWYFVNELPVGGKQERDLLVDGLYRDDGLGLKKIRPTLPL